MFFGSFAWSFVFVSLPFHIHRVSTLDSAATLRWTGWIIGITCARDGPDRAGLGPLRSARQPQGVLRGGRGAAGARLLRDGAGAHASRAVLRPAHPGRDGRGVD